MLTKLRPTYLLPGDLIAILIVTLVGFLTHGETIASPRWLTTFLPLSAAWLLYAPSLGLYRPEVVRDARQLWRAGLAALLVAPMAGFLRGVLLNQSVVVVFVAVLGATAALGMLIWRGLVVWLEKGR